MRPPLRVRFWKYAHGVVNTLAWKYARPSGPDWGIVYRIDQTRLLWRLNAYCAKGWSPWWLDQAMRRSRADD